MRFSTSLAFRWLTLAAVSSITVSGIYAGAQQLPAQRNNQRRSSTTATTTSPAAVAHHTFEQAARIMESALPIYDGHRARAIKLAKMAAMEIKEAVAGTPPNTAGVGGKYKTAAQRAGEVPKGAEKFANYSAAQISASNAKMQQGLQLLQQALSQVHTIGSDAAGHMNDAAQFGNYAIQAANAALSFIAGK